MRASATRQNPEPEKTTVVGVAAKSELSSGDVVAGDGEVVRSAMRKDTDPTPKVHWYQVLKGGNVMDSGMPVRLYVGKEISDSAYNIRRLLQQGVELKDLGIGTPEGPTRERHPEAIDAVPG